MQQLGKVTRGFLEDVVFRNLGAHNPSVIAKPRTGYDNAVISIGGRKVLILTSDPLSIIPRVGMKESAWLSIHLLASDLTTSGIPPNFAMLEFNLPPALSLTDFGRYLRALSDECSKLGIAIVGGHTGRYPGCGFPIVGGGVLSGLADEGGYVAPSMVMRGDDVILTKGAAIGATAVLARSFPGRVKERCGDAVHRKGLSYLRRCSTVKDALTAVSVGMREEGVTSMHDATEGGVLGGLHELSLASGRPISVREKEIFVSDETRSICSLFKLNPLVSVSEGALIITCRPDVTEQIRKRLRKNGIEAFAIGVVARERKPGLWLAGGGDGNGKPLLFVPPETDKYWNVYSNALAEGWR